jgi:prophage antirepressor-like protein
MTDSLFSLYDQIFTYKGREVPIIVDNDNMPWFSAIEIAEILKYGNTQAAIINNVDDIDKKQFIELRQFVSVESKNAQPHAVYSK